MHHAPHPRASRASRQLPPEGARHLTPEGGGCGSGRARREWLKAATALLAVCSEPRRTVSALRSPEFTRSLAHPKPLIGGQAGVGGKGRAALPLPHLRASGRGRG